MKNFNFLSRLESWMDGLTSRIRPVSLSYHSSDTIAVLTERQPRDDREMTESRMVRFSLDSILSRLSVASLICVLMLTVGVGNARGTETSHTCSGTSGTIVTSKITWAATSATWSSPQCRIAANGTVVFTLTGVNVTKIVMGFSSSSYIGNWSSSGGGSFSSNNSTVTWTGTAGAGTLTFTTSAAARLKTITVTYTDAASCTVTPTVGSSLTSVSATVNSITATVPISAIGGCNITENGLVYSTTNSTPTVGGTGCSKETVTACGSTAANKTVTISGLTCGQSYYVRGYATNAAGTSYTNVTTRSTSACPTYTVTYNAGTGTCGTAQWTQPSYGASTTLPSATAPAACTGYSFAGWCTSSAGNAEDNTTSPGTILDAGDSYTPTDNVTLYAVYTKTVSGGGSAAAVNTVMLAEPFTDFANNANPSEPGATSATVYDSGIEYVCNPNNTSSGTRIQTGSGPSGGSEGNNIIVKSGGYFQINNIPTGGAATLTFSCRVGGSNTLTISSQTADAVLGSNTGTASARTYTITINNDAETFDLRFAASGGNMRLDDIEIKVATAGSGGSTTYYMTSLNCCNNPGTALSITSASSVATGGTVSLASTGGNGGTVTWSVVAGTGTASISAGVLTGGNVGTVTVKAHQDATGGYCAQDAEQAFTVLSTTVNVTGVTVDPTSKAIVVGETFTITPTVAPNNATNKNVNWTSANSGIASVSSGTVTGVAAGGPVNITCTTQDGSFTANCATTVYGVTLQAKADDGNGGLENIGVGGPGAPTRSGTTITAAANAGNYVFKEWQIDNAAVASTTTSPTTISNPTNSVTVTAVYYKPINVTWKVGDGNASGGTAQVAYNTKITTLPTSPDDDDLGNCATKFMGWSATDIGSTPAVSAPSDLFTSASDAGVTALTSDQTYHAVFASVTSAGVDPTSITSFATGTYYFVAVNLAGDTYYAMTGTSNSSLTGTDITSNVTVNGNGTITIDPTGLTSSNEYTLSGTSDAAYVTTSGSAAVNGNSGSTSFGQNAWSTTITSGRFNFAYSSRSMALRTQTNTVNNYSNSNLSTSGYTDGYWWLIPVGDPAEYGDYVTKCCTQPLAPTVTVTPAGTTATVTWTTVTGNNGYQLKVEGSSSHNTWTDATSGATVSGLTANGTEYTACVRAKGNTGSGYCDYGAEGCQDFETTCTEYSFHTGSSADDATLKTTNTRTCFAAHPSDANQRIIENYVIPADTRFFVGKFGYFYNSDLNISSNGSQSVIKTFGAANADNGLYFNYTKGYGDGYRPGVGQATGAVGTLYIDVTSTWHNLHVGFDPAGYIFKLGSAYYTMSNSATLNATRYKESEILTLTSTDISGTFQVNIAAVAPNASTGVASAYTESKNLTTMRVKTGSGDSYRGTNINDAADANTRGFFRIDVGEGNSTNWAAHWVPCYRVTYNGNGASGSVAPSADKSCEGDDAARTVQAAANGFTAPSGKQFGGWASSPENAAAGTVAYAAGADVVLTGNITLYAVWTDINYTVAINQSPNVSATTTGQTSSAHSGNTINLTTTVPDGYRFENWTSSDVVITNNTSATTASFTMPASNVTVTANFVQTHTVTWKVSGSADNAVTYDDGAALVLPTPDPSAPSACSEKRFVGWKEGAIDGSTDTPPTLLNPGSLGTVTADKTYYAVFADEGESTTYTKVTDPASLRSGDKIVIICNSTNYGLRINNNTPDNSASTYADASTITPASDMVWTLAGNNTDGFTLSTASRTNDGAVTLGSSSDPGNNGSTTLILNNNYNLWKFSAHTTSNCLLITKSTSNYRGMEYYNSGWKVYNNSGVSSNAACAMRVYRKNLSGYVTTCSECVTPSDLEISDITSTGATVTWDGVSQTQQVGGSGTGYKVAWNTSNSVPSPLTASNSADVANGTNTYDITGLTAATQYYVFVQSKCDDSWSSSVNFHTNAKITYAANGGTGDPMPAKEVVYNAASTVVDACTFTAPSGKKFNGWVSSAAVTVNSGVTPTTAVPGGATINNLTQAITLTAQWRDLESYTVNFSADNGTVSGGTSTTVYEDGTLTFPNVTSTTCGTFQGWVEAAYDNAAKPSGATFHEVGDEIAVVAEMADKTYYAVYRVATGAPTNITDEITIGVTGVTGNYADFSGATASSAAIYAGNVRKDETRVQMRNSNSSGIVTTTSGGLAKKVTFNWDGTNTSGRIIDIYGKNTPYSSAADLYNGDAAVKGTLIGSITYNSTTELTISTDYEYIGIRANNGAAYASSIDVKWYGSPMKYQTSPACSPVVSMTSSFSAFTYVYGNGPSASQSFTVSGANLGANLVVTAPTNYEVCKTSGGTYTSSVSYTPSDGTVTDQTVYIRLAAGLNVGTYNYAAGSGLQVTSTGATTRTAALNGTVTKATGSIAFTSFNAVDHYEAEWTGSAILVPYNYIKTGDGTLTTTKVDGRGGAVDTENKKWSLTNEGTYQLRLTLGAGDNYTGAGPVTADFIIYKADRFYDNLHGNDMILKRNDAGEDHYTIPSLTDETRLTSGSCSETHYHFMGWVPESALSSLPNDAAYDAVMITGGGTQSASGTNYYAVWAEE